MENTKSSVEWLDEKNELRSRIELIIDNAEINQRELTPMEETQLAEYRSTIESINEQINKITNNITVQTNVRNMNEEKKFNFGEVVRSLATGAQLSEEALEVSKRGMEQARNCNIKTNASFYIPSGAEARTLAALTETKGAETVPTITLPTLEALRNNLVMNELQCTFISGAQANLELPRFKGNTVMWAQENEKTTPTDGQFDTISFSPHRLTCVCPISDLLLQMSNDDIQSMMMADIRAALAEKIESAAWSSNAPSATIPGGIFQNAATKTASYQTILECETELANNKINGNLRWLASPQVVATLKNTYQGGSKSDLKAVAQGDSIWGLSIDGIPVSVSQASEGLVLGRWQDFIMVQFGPTLVYLDNSRQDEAITQLIFHMFVDFKPRREEAFAPVKF